MSKSGTNIIPAPGSDEDSFPGPRDLPSVELGFVFAMPMEAAGVVDRLKKAKTIKAGGRIFHTGMFEGRSAAIVLSGVGGEKAVRATEVLLDVYRPKRLVSAGYGGALRKRLKRFAVCFPERVVRQADGRALDLTGPIPRYAEEPDRDTLGLLTTDFVAGTSSEKSDLAREYGTEIVDMETFYVAEICGRRRLPFLAVRIILDTADEEFPKDIRAIFKSAGRGGVRLAGSVLGSFFRRPSTALDLYGLHQRALEATDRLAEHLARELRDDNEDR